MDKGLGDPFTIAAKVRFAATVLPMLSGLGGVIRALGASPTLAAVTAGVGLVAAFAYGSRAAALAERDHETEIHFGGLGAWLVSASFVSVTAFAWATDHPTLERFAWVVVKVLLVVAAIAAALSALLGTDEPAHQPAR